MVPSPNIWHHPEVYELENRAQDADGVLWTVLRELCPWDGLDVVDVGCGDGFHLPTFAAAAGSVVGVEPHPSLVARARRRTAGLPGVRVLAGSAGRLPLADTSADLVHARIAYFFGPGCEPGLAEAARVLRPGGALVVIDLDATRGRYGEWMRADIPHYDPWVAESYFARQGFSMRRVEGWWCFADRASLAAVLRIEFSPVVAERAIAQTAGLRLPVGYRVHLRRRSIVG